MSETFEKSQMSESFDVPAGSIMLHKLLINVISITKWED